MSRFLVLYLAPLSALDQMRNVTPEQAKAGMEAWMAWAKQHERSLVELGAPLGKGKHVTTSGMSDAKSEIAGYSIVQADSLDAAGKLFAAHPHFHLPGAAIEIRECVAMPGA